MAVLEDFPEVIRKEEGVEEVFLFWLQKVEAKNVKRKRLMRMGKNGFEKVEEEFQPKHTVLPVYMPLFTEDTCIRVGMA